MPRRYVDYLPTDGFSTLNAVSSIGAFVLGASTLPFIWNVFKSYRYGRIVTVDDRGGSATRWSGRRRARRRGTTSPNCRASAPNARRSSCTTRSTWSGSARRHTSGVGRHRTRWPPERPQARPSQTTTQNRAEHRAKRREPDVFAGQGKGRATSAYGVGVKQQRSEAGSARRARTPRRASDRPTCLRVNRAVF